MKSLMSVAGASLMLSLGALVSLPSVTLADQPLSVKQKLNLNQIMANPDWIGNRPVSGHFSDDGKSFYYQQKRQDSSISDWYRAAVDSGEPVPVDASDLANLDFGRGVWNQDRSAKVYTYQGDIYFKARGAQSARQLTRTSGSESRPFFLTDGNVAYRSGNNYFSVDLRTGLVSQLSDLRLAKDPDAKPKPDDYLSTQQPRLFDYIEGRQADREAGKAETQRLRAANIGAPPEPWYLGEKQQIRTMSLSPNGRWLLVGLIEKRESNGRPDDMPRFVTDDGYVESAKVRALVGTRKPISESFTIFDLANREKHQLDLSDLPEITDDPLAELRKKAAKAKGKKYQAKKQPRPLAAYNWTANGGIEWDASGERMAMMLYSDDNKDRWIVRLDLPDMKLDTAEHLRDEAWVNDWDFNEFGWLPDNQTLYFLSERSGYGHLYLRAPGKRLRALTKGEFEVRNVTVGQQSPHLYFRANKDHPGIYEIHRVNYQTEELETLTSLGGLNDYELDLSESQLLIEHSSATRPIELHVQAVQGGPAKQRTFTISDEFGVIPWVEPEFIEVPSSHVDEPIHSRLYRAPVVAAQRAQKKPAVIFIHGAGYLQNAHQGWSLYFREFMFHSFLVQQGYVVLDMDYRASEGYGRDWRTAIYQQMGTPEVEDLKDGAAWLVENANVDPDKIGIYGGSYGGFLTFMGLFTEPEAFAAGAALRPVTDWAHYNHGYTSNILNTPELDPEAYERSSPIEFAEGLNKPLLIAHGMVDDNVFFKDSVRLVQRLIELEKTEYFETALYPVEPHGFVQPSSWLDEYKRIYYLFEDNLK